MARRSVQDDEKRETFKLRTAGCCNTPKDTTTEEDIALETIVNPALDEQIKNPDAARRDKHGKKSSSG